MTKDAHKLTLDQYQDRAVNTARPLRRYQDKLDRGVLGIIGELGEMTEPIKKFRHQGHMWTTDHERKILEELGDILWYAAVLANDLGHGLGDIAAWNLEKLEERYPEGFDEKKSRNRDG